MQKPSNIGIMLRPLGIYALSLALGTFSHKAQALSGSPIVFASDRSGLSQIWRINPDGSGMVQLTSDSDGSGGARWSSDGTRIAFVRRTKLMVMDSCGGNERQISTYVNGFGAIRWAPGDSYLAYGKRTMGDWFAPYYRINLDGSGEALFISDYGKSMIMGFHPSGSRVVWAGATGNWEPTVEMYTAPIVAGTVTLASKIRLTSNSRSEDCPSFSPDGATIAFTQTDNPGGWGDPHNIHLINADGSNDRKVTFYTGSTSARYPVWSPDGKQIVYQRQSGSRSVLVLHNIASGAETDITDGSYNSWEPHWSPTWNGDVNMGLVAYYPLDLDAHDATGNGHDGALHGPSAAPDHNNIIGGGLHFDGTDDYIEVPDSSDFHLQRLTVACWVRSADWNVLQTVLGKDDFLKGYQLVVGDAGEAWMGVAANGEWYVAKAPCFSLGQWEHVAGTYDGQYVRMFVNGVERAKTAYSGSIAYGSRPIQIGRNGYSLNAWLDGDLDDLRIYNRALSEAEIWLLFSGSYEQVGRTVDTGKDKNSENEYVNKMCGKSGKGSPVFVRCGNYRTSASDGVLPSRGLPLQITRFYNSVEDYDGPFSHGWCFNQTVQLMQTVDEGGQEAAIIRWANGVRKDFTLTDGVYQAPLSCYDTLTTNAIGFLLEMPSGMELQFNQGGFLVAQTERNGNTVTYEHDLQNRISRVTSADGRTLDYRYDESINRVSEIEDWSGRIWQYGYSTNDDLVSVTYPDGAIIRYTYDAKHNLTGTHDARSNLVSSLTYDADADKTTSYAEGSAVSYSFAYDSASNTTYKTDSRGRPWSFRYNQYGNKENLVDPAGQEVQFTWTGNQEISGKTDPRGYPQHFEYDSRGNVIAVSNALGHVTRYTYETNFNQVTSITDPLGNVVSNLYDAHGNLIWSQDARGFVTEFHYDSFGQLTNAVDARGQATAMTYNPHGELLNVTDPLGNNVSYTYDERGNRLTMTDARGNVWRYAYDIMDRLVAVTNPLGQASSYVYDANGNRSSVTDARSNTTWFAYDEYNRLASVSNALGHVTAYEYDIYGNPVVVRDALGNTASNAYDILNRLVETTDPLGNVTSFSYDENGNRTAVTDPLTNATAYAFDPLNRMVSMTNAVGGVLEYAYDANHNLLAVTDARDKTSENQYDARNMVTNSANAMGHAYRYTHDGNGNVIERTDPNGATLVYSYDDANRLTNIAYPNGTALAFSHDENGNVTVLSNATETVSYAYDPLNRVTNVFVVGLNKAIAYEYDAVGNRAAMIDPDGGRTEYAYDALNRLTELTDPGSNTWTFAYDAINRMTNMTMPNGIVATYQYDPGSRLTDLTYRNSSNSVLQSFAYTYDAVGNPISVKREDNAYELYQYDKTYQLTRVDYDATNAVTASTNWTEYVYDLVGNRLTLSRAGESETYEYDDANRLLSVTSAASLVTFGWDDNGNMTNTTENGTNTWYAWDYENKLVRVTYHDGSTNAFAYYPSSSLRHTKVDSTGTNHFVYDGQNLLQELDGLGTLVAQYQYSLGIDSLLARTAGGNQQYYLRDMIGSVTAVADADEDLLATYRYDAFGTVRRETGAADNPYLFTSRRLDQDSGLYYYRARYMSATMGAFLGRDSLGQGDDYTYVQNRPTLLMDPSGNIGTIPSFGGISALDVRTLFSGAKAIAGLFEIGSGFLSPSASGKSVLCDLGALDNGASADLTAEEGIGVAMGLVNDVYSVAKAAHVVVDLVAAVDLRTAPQFLKPIVHGARDVGQSLFPAVSTVGGPTIVLLPLPLILAIEDLQNALSTQFGVPIGGASVSL